MGTYSTIYIGWYVIAKKTPKIDKAYDVGCSSMLKKHGVQDGAFCSRCGAPVTEQERVDTIYFGAHDLEEWCDRSPMAVNRAEARWVEKTFEMFHPYFVGIGPDEYGHKADKEVMVYLPTAKSLPPDEPYLIDFSQSHPPAPTEEIERLAKFAMYPSYELKYGLIHARS